MPKFDNLPILDFGQKEPRKEVKRFNCSKSDYYLMWQPCCIDAESHEAAASIYIQRDIFSYHKSLRPKGQEVRVIAVQEENSDQIVHIRVVYDSKRIIETEVADANF